MAEWLRVQGHQADHVADLGLLSASDSVIWNAAQRTGSVIVTKDRDFADRALLTSPAPPIVWIRFGNTRQGELKRRFASALPLILAHLDAAEPVIEVR